MQARKLRKWMHKKLRETLRYSIYFIPIALRQSSRWLRSSWFHQYRFPKKDKGRACSQVLLSTTISTHIKRMHPVASQLVRLVSSTLRVMQAKLQRIKTMVEMITKLFSFRCQFLSQTPVFLRSSRDQETIKERTLQDRPLACMQVAMAIPAISEVELGSLTRLVPSNRRLCNIISKANIKMSPLGETNLRTIHRRRKWLVPSPCEG